MAIKIKNRMWMLGMSVPVRKGGKSVSWAGMKCDIKGDLAEENHPPALRALHSFRSGFWKPPSDNFLLLLLSRFAEFCLVHLLLKRNPVMFSQHFIECIFHFNSYEKHQKYNRFPQSQRSGEHIPA